MSPRDPSILQVELMFASLDRHVVVGSFPPPGTLSRDLTKRVEKATTTTFSIDTTSLNRFPIAAIEMWHRSVHSFLISASLTESSPLWSSVAGYYSSHYVMRAFAHLLGYFQLFSIRKIIELQVSGRSYTCSIVSKKASDGEHKLYWRLVKSHNLFMTNPFFTKNEDAPKDSDTGRSDVSHRNKSNYLDLLNGFRKFQVLDDQFLKSRIERISGIELSDAPIPRMDQYPDLVNVQLIAYQRLVSFRSFLDDILGGSNRFWNFHRLPSWAPRYMDYQVVKPEFITIYEK